MATIRPFSGLRYTPAAGDLAALVAPPYDVIDAPYREDLGSRSEFNVVHLTLPESKSDDRSKFIKYSRSHAALSLWRREGVLGLEAAPAIYRYVQTFTVPGSPKTWTRTTFLALLKVEPYAKGVVLPHEQTFPKHKEDRLRILEATRTHLESIFGLYEDPAGEILAELQSAPAAESVSVTTDEGVTHLLEPITDPEALAKIVGLMEDKKVWIADGHHRYETALGFREAKGEAEGLIPEDFLVMAFGSMADPGLALLPTHRIVKKANLSAEDVKSKMSAHFEIAEIESEKLNDALEAAGLHAFGFVTPGSAFLATPKDVTALLATIDGGESLALKSLDVTILHRVILENVLNIQGLEQIQYTRDPEEALSSVANGAALAILMNPPSVEDMKEIALGGEKMPQKSTFYYPKILSGLVLWSLNDF